MVADPRREQHMMRFGRQGITFDPGQAILDIGQEVAGDVTVVQFDEFFLALGGGFAFGEFAHDTGEVAFRGLLAAALAVELRHVVEALRLDVLGLQKPAFRPALFLGVGITLVEALQHVGGFTDVGAVAVAAPGEFQQPLGEGEHRVFVLLAVRVVADDLAQLGDRVADFARLIVEIRQTQMRLRAEGGEGGAFQRPREDLLGVVFVREPRDEAQRPEGGFALALGVKFAQFEFAFDERTEVGVLGVERQQFFDRLKLAIVQFAHAPRADLRQKGVGLDRVGVGLLLGLGEGLARAVVRAVEIFLAPVLVERGGLGVVGGGGERRRGQRADRQKFENAHVHLVHPPRVMVSFRRFPRVLTSLSVRADPERR